MKIYYFAHDYGGSFLSELIPSYLKELKIVLLYAGVEI